EEKRGPMKRLRLCRASGNRKKREGGRITSGPFAERVVKQPRDEQQGNCHDKELEGVDRDRSPVKLSFSRAIDDRCLKDKEFCRDENHKGVCEQDLPQSSLADPDEPEESREQNCVQHRKYNKSAKVCERRLDCAEPQFQSCSHDFLVYGSAACSVS